MLSPSRHAALYFADFHCRFACRRFTPSANIFAAIFDYFHCRQPPPIFS